MHDVPAGSAPLGTLLAAGTFDEGAHPRVRVLLEGLAARGWDVERVVEPLRFDTRRRVEVLRNPLHLPGFAVALLRAWSRLGPRLAARRRRGPRPRAVVVGHLGHFDVGLVRLLLRPAPVVLDYLISGAGTAVDRGERGALKQRALVALDRFALARADVVVVDTAEHLELLGPDVAARAVVVPVGADARWFAARASAQGPVRGRPLRVIFFGMLTPLQGAPVIARALRDLGGAVHATFVGTGQDEVAVDELLDGVPHVERMPWVTPDDLPALVAAHDVCLGIFGTGEKAARVVPNKAYQGAAAGCLVVTSDTAPQRRAFGEAAVLVPPGDADALADVLRGLADDADAFETRRAAARAWADARFTAPAVVGDLDVVLRGRA
ncbi:glycosyltransferase family 4 protein [Cellulomonas sp. SLBN-39]|uniref:glycosyltransferase family 4 protein n=1 Tax=Cellulomonas sp. SLBN-39 TaxID=2768446 RepID=UPI001170E801|nr:glycosyltransferase family 4 protein [Cellulomonas sp. SLBN-39]TQL03684.1 glycosyltransferase involved in cell wall biosynthesis [Cellulomonas sp. SLBN-39]